MPDPLFYEKPRDPFSIHWQTWTSRHPLYNFPVAKRQYVRIAMSEVAWAVSQSEA